MRMNVSKMGLTSAAMLTVVALAALLSGCIHNDLPYPRIRQMILAISAEGETRPAVIDSANLAVTVYIDEYINLRSVHFNVFEISEGGEADPNLLEGGHDFIDPVVVTISRFQSYQWVVTAEQHIERYFTVEGQIGETVLDEKGRRIIVRVPEASDLSDLRISSVRFGPEGITTISPELRNGDRIDLSRPVKVEVTRFGETDTWTIYAERTELSVVTSGADAWSRVVWAYGEADADADNGFQYRPADSEVWTDVAKENITYTGGAFSCCIPHLEPLTEYVVRAVSDDEYGNEIRVVTQATEDLPDGSFDEWWLDGKVWCPWAENGSRFWDTGNKGASIMGDSNVQPSDDTPIGEGQSVMCLTKFAGIAGIGKLAAGSIYTGEFVKVDGTNGILNFGRPWTLRPTRLRGYYKYTTAPINYASSEYQDLMGRPDSCHIYVALTDWTAPYEIRTNPKNRQLFDPSSPSVIAYGELIRGDDTNGWELFEIKLNYRSTSRVPSYMQITSAASKFGDFFTGGTGATLYVDQYSLEYDY